ncbi:hypothetical protein BHE74_00026581 [Ensete ventricosum]|nr:hypothetical protein BHE74_00026581 [Ensete ventricosum]
MDITEASIVHHIALVLLLLWVLVQLGWSHPVLFFLALLYLYKVRRLRNLVPGCVLELGMSFLSADDMSAKLAVRLRKRLGFGIKTSLHITSMHVEGKVLVGMKFLRHWPFLGRVRVCFVEPPYFQMTVKPIFGHGLDVTELPGISGWLVSFK